MRYMNLYLSASVPQLETFLAVKKVIDEWDPLHLFPSAPLDEYEQGLLAMSAVSAITMIAVGPCIGRLQTRSFTR